MNNSVQKKSNLKQIKIDEISTNLPNLKNIGESKVSAVTKWLVNTIETNANVKPGFLLPSKPEIAYLLGVSIGTIQNSLRAVEDLGYVESKQCIGTMVRDRDLSDKNFRKLTSKRETAINSIKKYILEKNLKIGQTLPSSRSLAQNIGCSQNTIRQALQHLTSSGIIENSYERVIKSLDFDVKNSNNKTLVNKVADDLKNYINGNLKTGDRMPAHDELSQKFRASIKTIHDALKSLMGEGILLARRGRYGTTVIKMPDDKNVDIKKETSIFASAPEAAFYYYEKTQNNIKKMIAENFEIGAKLPSISELSKQLDLSPNTVRKAVHNLAKEGYLTFSRGRYGGTFVTDIPDEQAFKWLAVNQGYVQTTATDNRL